MLRPAWNHLSSSIHRLRGGSSGSTQHFHSPLPHRTVLGGLTLRRLSRSTLAKTQIAPLDGYGGRKFIGVAERSTNHEPVDVLIRKFMHDRNYAIHPAQEAVIQRLRQVETRLVSNYQAFDKRTKTEIKQQMDKGTAKSSGHWSWSAILGNERQREIKGQEFRDNRSNRGLYVYGPVGQGKSMMVDIFIQALTRKIGVPGAVIRCHYHHFMLVMHKALNDLRSGTPSSNTLAAELAILSRMRSEEIAHLIKLQHGTGYTNGNGGGGAGAGGEDFISLLTHRFLTEGVYVLALDELQINTIADALILKRILTSLFEKGIVLVVTTNCAVDRLYENGLNRSQFLPFLPVLRKHCEEIMLDTACDMRCAHLDASARADTFWHLVPHSAKLESFQPYLSDFLRNNLSSGLDISRTEPLQLFHGRVIIPSFYHRARKIVGFSFDELFAKFHSASDYIAIAQAASNGLFLWDLPQLKLPDDKDSLRRFISFIDVMYDERVPVHFFSSVKPLTLVSELFPIVQTFDKFLKTARTRFPSLSAMWSSLFEEDHQIDEIKWTQRLRTWEDHSTEDLRLLFECIESSKGMLTLDRLKSVSAFHGDFAVPSVDESEVRALEDFVALGANQKDCYRLLNVPDEEQDQNGAICVEFAVPRLISRLCEMSRGYK